MLTPILAEGETAAFWTALALFVGGLPALIASYFAYLAVRDKLKFDSDVRVMKTEFAGCKKDCEECKKDRMEDRAAFAQREAKQESEMAALRQVVDELRQLRQQQKNDEEQKPWQ